MSIERRIWKYELELNDYAELELPVDAEILSVGIQDERLYIWASVNPDENVDKVKRKFRIAGTGHPLTEDFLAYIGTAFMMGGIFVWHVFEIGR